MKKQYILITIGAVAGIALAVYAYKKYKSSNEKVATTGVSVSQGNGLGVVDNKTPNGVNTILGGTTGTTYVPGQAPVIGQKKPGAK